MPQVQSHIYLTMTYITDHKKFVEIGMLLLIAQYISVRHIKCIMYAVGVTDRSISVSQTIKIQGPVCSTILHLRGLVYHGYYHFTCQIVDQSGNIWYHDGMSTGRTSTKEGKFGTVSQPNLKMCRNRKLCLMIYAQNS
jgi:hypothetical protein